MRPSEPLKAVTFAEYMAARRDWNSYASRLPEEGREQYRGAESEIAQILHLFNSEDFAHRIIRNPLILRDYAQTLAGIEEFKAMIKG